MFNCTDSDGSGSGDPASKPSRIPLEPAVIRNRPNWFLRMIGAKFREDRGWRFTWGEWSRRWGVGVELINWGEDGDWSLKLLPIYGEWFIKLPFMPRRDCDDMLDNWGFSWNWDSDNRGADIHFNWGRRSKIAHLPWDYVHVRSSMLCDDGIWRKSIGSWEWLEGDPLPAKETHHYRYVCRDGTVQDDVDATISVSEMEWRWRMLRWTRFGALIRRTIDIEFSKEVGNQRDSWKGGVTACSHQMRDDETPEECLHRMRRERSFDR